MLTDHLIRSTERASGALEVALHAREQEKQMALLAGMYKAVAHSSMKAKQNVSSRVKMLLTSLFIGA